MESSSFAQYLENSEILIDSQSIDTATQSIARAVAADFNEKQPVFLCVMNGGLPFTAKLMAHSHYPLQLDYIHATRYGRSESGGDIQWLALPTTSLKGRHVLIIDDILDEGITLSAIHQFCIKQGAASVKAAVLFEKVREQKSAYSPDYIGLTVPNRFVFGFGLDVQGFGRNLPAVYALKEA